MPSVNRNRIIGGFEDSFEKGQSTFKKTTKNAISDTAAATKNQITGGTSSSQNSATSGIGTNEAAVAQASAPTDLGTNEGANPQDQAANQQKTDEERVKFLRDLYGSDSSTNDGNKDNKEKKKKGSGDVTQAIGVPQKDPHEGMSPEEIAKYEAAKRQLHGDYYQEFIEKSKSKDQPVKEKLEREEQEKKMEALETQQEKKKRELPVTVKQGTAETSIGTVG